MEDDDDYDLDCPERREAGDGERPPAPAGDGGAPNAVPPREPPALRSEPASSSSAPPAPGAMGLPNEGNSGSGSGLSIGSI